MTETIARARLLSVAATEKTTWLFVALTLDDGRTGWGESSLGGREAAVRAAADALFPTLVGAAPGDPDGMTARFPFHDQPNAALSSAVAQALWDLDAQRAGVCLAERLGGRRRDRVGLYANINRRTRDRSPEGMAASADDARVAGFDAFKIAPFDEVKADLSRTDMRKGMETGLARVAAIRDAVGPDARLMVDCHWRFDATGAEELIGASRGLELYWIECPVSEDPDMIPVIRDLRHKANASGIRLAGLETKILADGFRPYLEGGAYDVMMPDVKYAGGPAEMLRIAALFAEHGAQFSPHNPTGPICHAQSLHVCAALADSDLLEHQYDECAAFDAIVGHPFAPAEKGSVVLDWTRPGLGIALTEDCGATIETEMHAGDSKA